MQVSPHGMLMMLCIAQGFNPVLSPGCTFQIGATWYQRSTLPYSCGEKIQTKEKGGNISLKTDMDEIRDQKEIFRYEHCRAAYLKILLPFRKGNPVARNRGTTKTALFRCPVST